MTNPNEPAFPELKTLDGVKDTLTAYNKGGLTKREYFAAMMMSAILGNPTTLANLENSEANVALFALQIADALIAELNKEAKRD